MEKGLVGSSGRASACQRSCASGSGSVGGDLVRGLWLSPGPTRVCDQVCSLVRVHHRGCVTACTAEQHHKGAGAAAAECAPGTACRAAEREGASGPGQSRAGTAC